MHCKSGLYPMEIVVNPKHLYPIGIMYRCGSTCNKTKVWTNSIRGGQEGYRDLIDYLNGETERFYQGICNDKYCGMCFGFIQCLKNGYPWPGMKDNADIYGCRSCDNKFAAWLRIYDEENPDLEKLAEWGVLKAPDERLYYGYYRLYARKLDELKQIIAREKADRPERRNPDESLRALARRYTSERSEQLASKIIAGAKRSGQLPWPIQELLTFNYGPPPLDFVCGFEDVLGNEVESARIRFIANFKNDLTDDTFVWLHIIRGWLRKISQLIIPAISDFGMFTHISVMIPKKKLPIKGIGGNQLNPINLMKQLSEDVEEALRLLDGVSPNFDLPHQSRIKACASQFSKWGYIFSQEGPLFRASPQETVSIQMAGFNFIETMEHLLNSLLNRVGEPYQFLDGGQNRRYDGGPFLYHWTREHGTLNPNHHLADIGMQRLARLTQLQVSGVDINWPVVYSNAFVGCYFSYCFYLAAIGELILYPIDMPEIRQIRMEMDQLEDRRDHLNRGFRQTHPSIAALEANLDALDREAFELGEGATPDLQLQITATYNQMMISQSDLINSAEWIQIRDRLEHLSQQIDLGSTTEAIERETQFRFWRDLSPMLPMLVADYLVESGI